MKSVSLYEFGGSESLLRNFQTRFIPLFRGYNPVLDIGCGRGIFLGLAAEAGIEAVGVDHAEESVEFCRKKGFSVHQEDVRSFLERSPEIFGGIFCSHVIEHMGYEDASRLLALCHRALRNGGKLILLTPNPEDLAVIAETFWLDPTHVRPYPKLLLHSMLATAGFDVTDTKQVLGSWRMIGRSKMPLYFWRRMLLGRYYGHPNTIIVATKSSSFD
jgi:O-antigen chain-terminating methyltransferase